MNPVTLAARHIAVEGPIGVGKTSLVELLASRFEGVKIQGPTRVLDSPTIVRTGMMARHTHPV